MITISKKECASLSLQETLERIRAASNASPVTLPEGGVTYNVLLNNPVFEGWPSNTNSTRREECF